MRLIGWCAFNKGEIPEIDNISFEKTKRKAYHNWGKCEGQEIRKCVVIISDEKEDV